MHCADGESMADLSWIAISEMSFDGGGHEEERQREGNRLQKKEEEKKRKKLKKYLGGYT